MAVLYVGVVGALPPPASNNASFSTAVTSSSETRHPSENEGKKPQRCPRLKRDVPSMKPTAMAMRAVFLYPIFTSILPEGIMIVLGAQMKPDGPSRVLQYRLDAAYDYLVENPDTKVIVSGGQGSDEMISEAQGMYDYLAGRGIEKERIIREDRSVNTVQNLKYSAEFLDREQDSVCIVSNNFHMFRARRLAEKLGYQKVCGLAAKGDPVLMANNMLREFFGVMKDFTYGNL